AEAPAAVRFLDAAGERALGADARAVRVGERRAGEGPRGEDQRILWRQRVDGRRAQFEERLGDPVAPRLDDRLAFELTLVDRPVTQLDLVINAHSGPPALDPTPKPGQRVSWRPTNSSRGSHGQ